MSKTPIGKPAASLENRLAATRVSFHEAGPGGSSPGYPGREALVPIPVHRSRSPLAKQHRRYSAQEVDRQRDLQRCRSIGDRSPAGKSAASISPTAASPLIAGRIALPHRILRSFAPWIPPPGECHDPPAQETERPGPRASGGRSSHIRFHVVLRRFIADWAGEGIPCQADCYPDRLVHKRMPSF